MVWPSSRAEARDARFRGASAWHAALDLSRRTTLPELRAVPITELPGVGPRIAASLKDLNVTSLADLVSHYPSRDEHRDSRCNSTTARATYRPPSGAAAGS